MIQFKCYLKGGYIGTIGANHTSLLLEGADPKFEVLINNIAEKGFYIEKSDKTLYPADKEFIFILEAFLQKCGVELIRLDTELLQKLKDEIQKADPSISQAFVDEVSSDLTIYETSLLLKALEAKK